MAKEIERKFLLKEPPKFLKNLSSVSIEQGYIAIEPDGKEVRVRQKGGYFLTVKSSGGQIRQEWEIEITQEQFEALWEATEGQRLQKDRYSYEKDGNLIEIDVYRGFLKGLFVAEVEFSSEEKANNFQPFDWMGKEVTENKVIKNKNLWRVKSMKQLIKKMLL